MYKLSRPYACDRITSQICNGDNMEKRSYYYAASLRCRYTKGAIAPLHSACNTSSYQINEATSLCCVWYIAVGVQQSVKQVAICCMAFVGNNIGYGSANDKLRYNVTSLIGWEHTRMIPEY